MAPQNVASPFSGKLERERSSHAHVRDSANEWIQSERIVTRV
jgi:hypothetical protein